MYNNYVCFASSGITDTWQRFLKKMFYALCDSGRHSETITVAGAASPRRAQNHTGPPKVAARIQFCAAGRTPLTRHTTTPLRLRLPTPHGLARVLKTAP